MPRSRSRSAPVCSPGASAGTGSGVSFQSQLVRRRPERRRVLKAPAQRSKPVEDFHFFEELVRMKVVEIFEGEGRLQSQSRQRHRWLESREDFVEGVDADGYDRTLIDGQCVLGAGAHQVAHDENTHRFLARSLRRGPLRFQGRRRTSSRAIFWQRSEDRAQCKRPATGMFWN